jgi:hypothetical protein
MADAVTTLTFEEAIAQARAKLEKPKVKPVSAWRGLGAAALMAFSALTLAAAVILGPGGGGPHSRDAVLSHWEP